MVKRNPLLVVLLALVLGVVWTTITAFLNHWMGIELNYGGLFGLSSSAFLVGYWLRGTH